MSPEAGKPGILFADPTSDSSGTVYTVFFRGGTFGPWYVTAGYCTASWLEQEALDRAEMQEAITSLGLDVEGLSPATFEDYQERERRGL